MIRRHGRLATSLVFAAVLSLVPAESAGAARSSEQELVEAYSPVVMVRAQEDPPCDTAEEQFNPPTTVDLVLGDPKVTLVHHVGDRDVPIRDAPSAADIAGLGDDYYLDLPGDPLAADCDYASEFADLKAQGKAPAVTYAHIARQPDNPGLVVQYWFFYYFNQFNDLHEGDWEGMQIGFEASSPKGALSEGPSEIALFQHAGGERGDWDDPKVQKDGTHPIVYPAAGSHATFYDDAIYIEHGEKGSGVGCDNTSEPLSRTDPTPVLVPTEPPAGSRFQWLTYLGHWGEREKGFNNGPQGPVTKSQWLEPFSWMNDIRETSPRLPGGAILGPAAATAFCGAIAGISDFINLEAKSRAGAVGVVLVLILLVLLPALLTRWRPVELESLRHRWAFGQLIRGARQLYGRHWRVLLPIGLSAIPILLVIDGIEWLFVELNGSSDFTVRITPGDTELKFGGSIGGVGQPIGFAIVSGAVIAFMRLMESGEQAGFISSYRAMFDRLWRVVAGQLLAVALVVLLLMTVIGIPYAIYKYISWQFIQQEILFEDRSIREAFRGSSRLVKGRWWRTVRVAGFLWLLSVIAGPVLGFFLIFANLSAVAVNLIGSLVFALLVPYVAIGRTLLYFDLEADQAEEAAGASPRRRRWLPRIRPATGTG